MKSTFVRAFQQRGESYVPPPACVPPHLIAAGGPFVPVGRALDSNAQTQQAAPIWAMPL